MYAPIAQLDRVTDYESVGRGFESLSAYQKNKGKAKAFPLFFAAEGLERAAPVGTLVQKRASGTFLARGRVHGTLTAAGTAVGNVPL